MCPRQDLLIPWNKYSRSGFLLREPGEPFQGGLIVGKIAWEKENLNVFIFYIYSQGMLQSRNKPARGITVEAVIKTSPPIEVDCATVWEKIYHREKTELQYKTKPTCFSKRSEEKSGAILPWFNNGIH